MAIATTTDPYGDAYAITGSGGGGLLTCPPLLCGNSEFSIGVWFYQSSAEDSNRHTVFKIPVTIGTVSSFLEVYSQSGYVYCYTSEGSFDFATTPTTDAWHHFAVTCDSSGVLQCYLDGTPKTPAVSFGVTSLAAGSQAVLSSGPNINLTDAHFDFFISLSKLDANTILWYYQDKVNGGVNSLPPG